ATLAAGGQWEIQTALHLSSWASTYSGANDFYHTGYAVGALPVSYTTTSNIPAYISGLLASGSTPCGTGPTATHTNTPAIATATSTPTVTFTPPTGSLPDLIITSVVPAPQGWTGGCTTNLNMGVNV